MTKIPNPIDQHVGARVRMQRTLAGLSQEKLGDGLGITFQQIQKYEKGTNRIGASRLQDIARILGVPVNFFFEGAKSDTDAISGFAENAGSDYTAEAAIGVEARLLISAFHKIKEPKLRKKIIDLVQAMAAESGG
jgi:transcriptional regulator with XRE-family HTH domain